MELSQEQMEDLTTAITRIAHGDVSGPAGLEGVAMALAGEGKFELRNVSDGLYLIASAIRDLAEAVNNHSQSE